MTACPAHHLAQGHRQACSSACGAAIEPFGPVLALLHARRADQHLPPARDRPHPWSIPLAGIVGWATAEGTSRSVTPRGRTVQRPHDQEGYPRREPRSGPVATTTHPGRIPRSRRVEDRERAFSRQLAQEPILAQLEPAPLPVGVDQHDRLRAHDRLGLHVGLHARMGIQPRDQLVASFGRTRHLLDVPVDLLPALVELVPAGPASFDARLGREAVRHGSGTCREPLERRDHQQQADQHGDEADHG